MVGGSQELDIEHGRLNRTCGHISHSSQSSGLDNVIT